MGFGKGKFSGNTFNKSWGNAGKKHVLLSLENPWKKIENFPRDFLLFSRDFLYFFNSDKRNYKKGRN